MHTKEIKSPIDKLEDSLNINSEAIAQGIYNMIPEDEKACMVVGMLPAKFMTLLEKQLKSKFEGMVKGVRLLNKATFNGMDEYLKVGMAECDQFVSSNTNKTMLEVTVNILKIATADGLCKV